MKEILIYSPDVIGHPRVYCRVIADAVAKAPCTLTIALGFTDQVGLAESPDLQPLESRENVTLLATRDFSKTGDPHLTAEEIVALQNRLGIDTTLFIEADKSDLQFKRIAAKAAPALIGRNLGIYAKTAEWYPGEDSFTGEPKRLLAPTLKTTLGNFKRAVFNRGDTAKHFFEKIIFGSRVLDEILVKDERLASWHGPPVYWMPEISRPAGVRETEEERAEFIQRQRELAEFLNANADREPVLYFGDAAFYKGYDLFLEFVASTPGTCGVHPGRTYDEQQRSFFKTDVEVLRRKLLAEGRLYETNTYVHTQRQKELFFGCIRIYLTTHRLALSSSTVIQALEMGKPILVPDRGLLGYRVKANNLGSTYRYGDIDDLRREAEKLWNSDLTRFSLATDSFWARFSDSAIQEFFSKRLLGS